MPSTSPSHTGPLPAPRVAVIVPAYGVAALVGQALTSLQRQTFDAWEAVVIDDGDAAVARAVAPFLRDPRIRLVASENRGVSAARNRAVAESGAPLLALLDGDDLFLPTYLATLVPLLENDPTLTIATCNARIFGAVSASRLCVERPHAEQADWLAVLDRSFNVYIGSVFRRADFDAIGGFDTAMHHAEDLDLWVRLLRRGGKARYVDAALGEYRVRAGSASSQAAALLRGSLRVQEKMRGTVAPGSPESLAIERLMNTTREALAFETAIDRIVAGQARAGIADLRGLTRHIDGPVWHIALAMWHWLPALAAPMLRWRRRAHSRGSATGTPEPSFLERET